MFGVKTQNIWCSTWYQTFKGLDIVGAWIKLSQKVEPKNDIYNWSSEVLGTENKEHRKCFDLEFEMIKPTSDEKNKPGTELGTRTGLGTKWDLLDW